VAHEPFAMFKSKVYSVLWNHYKQRKSHTSIGEIYFWTAAIHKWMHLLNNDSNKQLIVDYLKKLSGVTLAF
jgi:hypothetical protein